MSVRVAACQLAIDVDDPAGTRTRLERAVLAAAEAGARLVVLPELAAAGSCFASRDEALAVAQPVDGEFVTQLAALSARLGCVLVSGICEADGDQVYNSAVVLDQGELRTVYRKVHLWGIESRLFTPGARPPDVVDTSAGRVAPLICYDLEFPEWVRRAADRGAEIIAGPANWPLLPRPAGERPLEVTKAQAFAGTYRVFVVIADRCGTERGQEWIGGSTVVGADGYPMAGPASDVAGEASPQLLLADLDLGLARDKSIGPYNDARRDRRPDLYDLARLETADHPREHGARDR